MKDLNDLTPYEQGEFDAVHNYEAALNQPKEYYWGYGDQYSREQIETARCEQHLREWGIEV